MTSEPLGDRAIPARLADRLCYRRETEISGWVTPRLSNLLSRPLVSKSTGPATSTEEEAREHVFAVRQTKPMLYWSDTSCPPGRAHLSPSAGIGWPTSRRSPSMFIPPPAGVHASRIAVATRPLPEKSEIHYKTPTSGRPASRHRSTDAHSPWPTEMADSGADTGGPPETAIMRPGAGSRSAMSNARSSCRFPPTWPCR